MIYENVPTRSLMCLDVTSGDVKWHTREYTLGAKDDPRHVSFVTPPLVLPDRVIVGGWIHTGHVNTVIASFDRRLGTPLWNTHLASNQMELTMFGEWAREPLGWVMLEDEGVLYCVTGIGVVAALDASDGRILWLGSYQTLPILPSRRERCYQLQGIEVPAQIVALTDSIADWKMHSTM